jgi:thioredoxin-related protein
MLDVGDSRQRPDKYSSTIQRVFEEAIMNSSTFRKHLDVITTILVVALFVTMAVVYVHGRFYKKQVDPAGSTIAKDLRIADALKLDYKTHSRTLILALDKDCAYCERSAGFYKRLLDLQATSAGNTQLVAALPNDDWEAKQYLRKEGLERLPHLSNVKLGQLKITALPALILVDRLGRVLESWSGQLDEEREKQVVEAINNRTQTAIKPPDNLTATFDLFNETKPTHTFNLNSNSLINIIDVDAQSHIYVQKADQIEKRNVDGAVVEEIPIPSEVTAGAACAGSDGDFHFILPQKILTSRRNGSARITKESRLPLQLSAVNARYDTDAKSIFILSNSTTAANASEHILYRFNITNGELSEIHRAQLPIVYNDAIGLGRISYAIGGNKLFVSDPTEYKIYVYSLENNSLLTTFTRPFDRPLIGKSDGEFESRNIVSGDLSQGGLLKHYPAIFNLHYISSKNLLLVWTSARNSSYEQMIDIFDSDLHAVGRDFKPTNPLFSSYHFVGDRVIAPDYGFGKEFHLDFLSPLEPPYHKPTSIKTFELSALQRSS